MRKLFSKYVFLAPFFIIMSAQSNITMADQIDSSHPVSITRDIIQKKLIENVSTLDEVKSLFGKPSTSSSYSNTESLTYNFKVDSKNQMSPLTEENFFTDVDPNTVEKILIVMMFKDDKLQGYSISTHPLN